MIPHTLEEKCFLNKKKTNHKTGQKKNKHSLTKKCPNLEIFFLLAYGKNEQASDYSIHFFFMSKDSDYKTNVMKFL